MILSLFLLIINSILQNDFKWPWEEERPIEELFEGPSIVLWVLAWVFFGIGMVSLLILVLYSKYGREISIKLSIITILTSSIFLGFSIHFFMLQAGY
ncbi:MAG: hypothetical protein EU532_02475 [Promethearchaeota archaeon]|nr:MAG: hypothetical protein EU532_02475 [Candidatus Lokiarchaeota archaeon]